MEAQESWWCSSSRNLKVWESEDWSLRIGEDRSISLNKEQIWPSFDFFILFGFLTDWKSPPHWWGQSSLFDLLIQNLISSINTLIDTPKNNDCQLSGYLLAQSSWYTKLITTIVNLVSVSIYLSILDISYGWKHSMWLVVFGFSHCIMLSRFTNVATCGNTPFLFMAE